MDHRTTAEARLGEAIAANRDAVLGRLAELEWAADPRDPMALVRNTDEARRRAALFLDVLVGGLENGDWTHFDSTIGARTIELLVTGRISAAELNERALLLTTFLLPSVLALPEPAPVVAALFGTMQMLSGEIVSAYNEKLLAETRQLDDLKTMFLRMTGHELRGPLGTIHGYASMLESGDFGPLDPQVLSAVRAIDSSSSAALGMLDRVVEVARLESGAEAIHRERVELRDVVEAALEPLRQPAAELAVRVDVDRAEGEAVLDPDEMEIALRNLVGNALKYGGGGGVVTLSAWREGSEAIFEVSDRGPGIADDEMALVFDRYYRSRGSRAGGKGGSGLGLYIVKRIAELHGGTADVEAVGGGGVKFKIRIPSGL